MDRYYQILGLPSGASKEEIKKAYRKMAMKFHPDVNPSPNARAKFTEILEAYEYLTGVRKAKTSGFKSADADQFYEALRKAAEDKAKAEYRARVREFRKKREAEQAKEYQKAIFLLIALIVGGIGVWQGLRFYKNLVINADPVYAEAQVVGLANKRVIYQFLVGDSLIEDRSYVGKYKITMISGNGMPLRIGDQFEVVYSASNPSYHKLNYQKVSQATMKRYLGISAKSLQRIYREEWAQSDASQQNVRAVCISLLVFKEYGFSGLSKLVFNDVNPLENFSNNSATWYLMSRSDKFQEIYQSCEVDPAFRSP